MGGERAGRRRRLRTLTRTGFWVAVVGTARPPALALKFGLDVRDINTQLDQYRRFPCPATPSAKCDVNGNSATP